MKISKRYVVAVAAVLVSAWAATGAGAARFVPASEGVPWTPLTKAEVQQAPTCQSGFRCYTPQMIKQAYDFPSGKKAPTGAGQTVVVVVAYGSLFLGADLAAFNDAFGLPPADLTVVPQQTVVAPAGSNDFPNWALETSLDVEYVHAMAPGAKIVLAVAANDDTSNLVQVQREVLTRYPSAVVVESFGGDETGPFGDPQAMDALDKLFAVQALRGGTVVAGSGDLGATNNTPFWSDTPFPMASYPASSPLVLAVGGTQGNPYPGGLWVNGAYGGEQVWNEVLAPDNAGASGGAASTVYPRPFWQAGLTGSQQRVTPDVAYNAAVNGGVIIAFNGRFGSIGGTSAGAPQWAAIVALANELRARYRLPQVGLVAPLLYLLARDRSTYRQDFNDITDGANALFGDLYGLPGFAAGPGYDWATGLGTPSVSKLLQDVAGRSLLSLRFADLLVGHERGGGKGRFRPGR